MKKRLKKVTAYTAVFQKAPEGGFSVFVPALPGCISEGDTFEEAEKNIKEAIELYLETVTDLRIPEEAEETFSVPVKLKI